MIPPVRRHLHSSDAVRPELSVTRRTARFRRLLALVVALAATAVALVAGPPAPVGATPGQDLDGRAQRVLVISVPGLTWAEVRDHDLPAIESLLEGSAMADMAPRGVTARSTPGAAYLTISAGTRAASDPLVDGQQLALGEQAGGSSAGDIFERRTGVEPDGSYVALAWPTLQRVNAREPYDAELGLLTDTLDEAGLGAEAIGNADGTDSVGTSYERQVGLAAATGDGVIPAGELDADLLVRDPSAAVRPAPRPRPGRAPLRGGVAGARRPRRRPGGRRGVRPRPVDALPRPGRRRPLRRAAVAGALRHRRPGGAPARPRRPAARRGHAAGALQPAGRPRPHRLGPAGAGVVARVHAVGLDPAIGLPHTRRRGADDPRRARRRPTRRDGGSAGRAAGLGRLGRDPCRSPRRPERGVAFPRAAALPDDAGRGSGAGPPVRGCHRGARPGAGAAHPACRGVRRPGRPGPAADVVPGARLPAGRPGRRLLLGVHRGGGPGRRHGRHRDRPPRPPSPTFRARRLCSRSCCWCPSRT